MQYAPVNAGQLLFGPLTEFLQQYNAEQRARTEREGVRAEDLAWRTQQAAEESRRFDAQTAAAERDAAFKAIAGMAKLPGRQAAEAYPAMESYLGQLGPQAAGMIQPGYYQQLQQRAELEPREAERARLLDAGTVAGRELVGTPGYRQKGLDFLAKGLPGEIDESGEKAALAAKAAARGRGTGGGGGKPPVYPLPKFLALIGGGNLEEAIDAAPLTWPGIGLEKKTPDQRAVFVDRQVTRMAREAIAKANVRTASNAMRVAATKVSQALTRYNQTPQWNSALKQNAAADLSAAMSELESAGSQTPVVGAPYLETPEPAAQTRVEPAAAPRKDYVSAPAKAAPAAPAKAAPQQGPKGAAPKANVAVLKQAIGAIGAAAFSAKLPGSPDFVLPDGTTKQQLMQMTPQEIESKIRSQK